MIEEKHNWYGKVKFTVYEGPMEDGVVKEEITLYNQTTDVGKTLLASAFGGVDARTKVVAWGTGTTAVSSAHTALATESGRKDVSGYAAGASTGQYITNCYIAPTEGNIHIYEIGWFGGATASKDTAGSGTMIARVLYDHNKLSTESIYIQRTDTIA